MKSMGRKIGYTYISLIVVVTLALGILSSVEIESYFRGRLVSELASQSSQLEHLLKSGSLVVRGDEMWYSTLQDYARVSNLRLTLIREDGVVLFESDLSASELSGMENHLMRPEVQEALKAGSGSESRHSKTLGVDLLYYAHRLDEPVDLPDGKVRFFRIAVPLTDVQAVTREIRWMIGLAGLVVIVLVTGLSLIVSRYVSKPIRKIAAAAREIHGGNLEKRMPIESNDEIGQLGRVLNQMLDKLNADIVQLRKLERIRSEFLGNVSHELRTPIFAVQGLLETLLNGALEDSQVNRDFLERAHKNVIRLNALLNDLIEISRIEFGEMKMSFRYFNVNEYLRSVVSEMLPTSERKGISLECALSTSDVVQVLGDKERLRQVMLNLIDNAVKYTESGGKVTVSARDEGLVVRISVADTGCGIAPEHLSRIFERFYRVDKDRSREMGGTGLGLAIVKHIVEAHGSKVDVESEVGKGSAFSFSLKK
jgi:two-component system phosphate regulon sensor histidine kinase PhoR